jgi:hypothetical protein
LLLSGTRALDLSPAIVADAQFLKLGVDSYLYLMEGGWHGASVFAVGTPEVMTQTPTSRTGSTGILRDRQTTKRLNSMHFG